MPLGVRSPGRWPWRGQDQELKLAREDRIPLPPLIAAPGAEAARSRVPTASPKAIGPKAGYAGVDPGLLGAKTMDRHVPPRARGGLGIPGPALVHGVGASLANGD